MKKTKPSGKPEKAADFDRRLSCRYDELKWLYCELYHNDLEAFDYFVEMLRRSWAARKQALREQDGRREADPGWYRSRELLGMMLYVGAFAGTLRGVEDRLPYLRFLAGKTGGCEGFLRSALALEVFRERGLIDLRREGDQMTLCLLPIQKKADLNACPYLIRLEHPETR